MWNYTCAWQIEIFVVTGKYSAKRNNCFCRSFNVSPREKLKEGSASVNLQSMKGFNLKTNFNIYDVNTETGSTLFSGKGILTNSDGVEKNPYLMNYSFNLRVE